MSSNKAATLLPYLKHATNASTSTWLERRYLIYLLDGRATHFRSSLENLSAQHSMHVKDSSQVRAGLASHSSSHGR